MYDYSPLVSERDMFRDVRDMEWTQSSPATADDLLDGLSTTLRPMAESANFDDIGESSFHCEESLLMEEDGLTTPHFFDFSEVAEASFHEGDSLLRDLRWSHWEIRRSVNTVAGETTIAISGSWVKRI